MSQTRVFIEQLPQKPNKSLCVTPCEPIFDSLGTTCGCKDAYYGPICSYAGITGDFGFNMCIRFDQDYGTCFPCLGCQKECNSIAACPFN